MTTTTSAVAAGELDAGRQEALGYESVTVSEDLAAPEMAVRAARDAIADSGIDPEEFGLVLHSSLWFQGRSMWAAGSYIAAQALSESVPAMVIQQRCNGGLGTLELAAGHLAAGTRGTAALLTTGDRFAGPSVDRWTTHGKAFYGDAGTAAVLSSRGGFARILATHTGADNVFEGMARGTGPFETNPQPRDTPIDLGARHSEFSEGQDQEEIYGRLFGVIHATRDAVLAEAGVKIDEVRWVIDAATRGGMDDDLYTTLYGFTPEQTTWDFGRTTGHLGSGDQFAGLARLVKEDQVTSGDLVLLFGGGAGFTCTAVLLEIL